MGIVALPALSTPDGSGVWYLVGVAFAGVVGSLYAIEKRLTHRASTPLPPPAPDALATYRDGPPPECPRHPFAR